MALCSQAEKANIEAVKCAQIAQQAGLWGFGFVRSYASYCELAFNGQVAEKKEDCMRAGCSMLTEVEG